VRERGVRRVCWFCVRGKRPAVTYVSPGCYANAGEGGATHQRPARPASLCVGWLRILLAGFVPFAC